MSRKKSAQQKIIEGAAGRIGVHKLDALLAAEPRVETGLLPPPRGLKGAALEAYLEYAEQLAMSELNKRPDRAALARACVNLALCWRADRAIEREGPVHRVPVMTGRGNARHRIGYRQVRNKWLAVREASEKAFARFAGNFGLLGPGSRAGMTAINSTKKDYDDLMEMLSQPRKDTEEPPPPLVPPKNDVQ